MFFSLGFQEFEETFLEENKFKIATVKNDIISFYMELCCQIKKRFQLNDSKLEILKFCNVAEIVAGTMPTIRPLLNNYPFKKTDVN